MSVVLCQTKFMQMFISADTWIMMLDGDQWEAHLHTLLSQFLNKIINEHSPDWAGPYSQFLHVLFCLCQVSLHFSPVCSWLHSNNYAIQIIMMKVLNVFIITQGKHSSCDSPDTIITGQQLRFAWYFISLQITHLLIYIFLLQIIKFFVWKNT